VLLCVQAKYLAASTGKDEETIMQDFSRPKYFSPFEAADYGIIDQVGGQERARAWRGGGGGSKGATRRAAYPWSLAFYPSVHVVVNNPGCSNNVLVGCGHTTT
jgi:hypothetical protein